MWGGILSYHNAMSELAFNSEVVFASNCSPRPRERVSGSFG
jgi:hypothetical protein